MTKQIFQISYLVREYSEAIEFFTKCLGFDLIEDTDLGNQKRWVIVGNKSGANLLLARAVNDDQFAAIGNQFGGRVGFFLQIADFDVQYLKMKNSGVEFCEAPRVEIYGKVAVFKDLYGQKWDLIELK